MRSCHEICLNSRVSHSTLSLKGLLKRNQYINKLCFRFSAPGQPEQVKVTVLSPRSIQVTWQAPKYSGNGVIGYEVYYNKTTAVMDTTTPVDDQTFGQEIRHLRPYTYYQVQVAATSYGVTGPKSFAKVVQTLEDGKL